MDWISIDIVAPAERDAVFLALFHAGTPSASGSGRMGTRPSFTLSTGGSKLLNHIVIMGRLARDPELRRTQNGTPVASFRLAVDRDFKDKDTGERATDWIDVVAWRSTAEFVCRYFTKGRMAVVDGRLQMRDWTDKEGNKRTSAEVLAQSVYFGDSKRDSDGTYGVPTGETYPPAVGSEFKEIEDVDGDLPF